MALTNDKLANEVREAALPVLVSFESGEQVTKERLYPPPSVDWELIGGRYEVVKALAATNAGTIDVLDASDNAAITQISIPASSAIGTRGTFTVSGLTARTRAGAGQRSAYHAITTAKGAAGGKVRLWFYYRRLRANAA